MVCLLAPFRLALSVVSVDCAAKVEELPDISGILATSCLRETQCGQGRTHDSDPLSPENQSLNSTSMHCIILASHADDNLNPMLNASA